MHWFLLVLAGLLEVGWAIGLKSSHGFTRFWPSVATLVLMALSFFLLASALKHLPIGTAYAGLWARRCSASSFSANRHPRRAFCASG